MTTHTIPARDVRLGDLLYIGPDACGRWAGPWHPVLAVQPCTLEPWGGCAPCCEGDCRHWDPRPGVQVLLDHREGMGHHPAWWPLQLEEHVTVSRPPVEES